MTKEGFNVIIELSFILQLEHHLY